MNIVMRAAAAFALVSVTACGANTHSGIAPFGSGAVPAPHAAYAAQRTYTAGFAAQATGMHLMTILHRRQVVAARRERSFVQPVSPVGGPGGGGVGGGSRGVSCKGGCTGGTSTKTGNGTFFNVGVTAPTPGSYVITGYTTDSRGVQTPIPSYTVNVSDTQAGPTEEVNASTFVPDGVDMANGISITVTGPNADDDPFDPLCDTGTGSWDFAP